MYIPRLRNKDNVIREIKKIDPNTAITGHLINKLVKSGELSKVEYGNAILINLDELAYFFTKKRRKK